MSDNVTACYACAIGAYAECLDPTLQEDGTILPCGFVGVDDYRAGRAAGTLAPEDITDPLSTGRKRAALLAPILTGMVCEWSGLKYAGGGVIPIVGCNEHRIADKKGGEPAEGLHQGDRHHGPDKATINNAVGQNLHRICKRCHNRWHTLNDPYYAGTRPSAAKPWIPSEPYYLHDDTIEASDDDREAVETWWSTEKAKRPPYPVSVEGLRQIIP